MPPLKDRKDDIPLLVDKFLHDIAQEYSAPTKKIASDAIAALQELEWTGNIRELHNVVERLVIMCDAEITASDVKRFT